MRAVMALNALATLSTIGNDAVNVTPPKRGAG
jgi:hypothetical protein